jgi:hypothetical protein
MTKVLIDVEFDKRKRDSFREDFTKSRRIREGLLFLAQYVRHNRQPSTDGSGGEDYA